MISYLQIEHLTKRFGDRTLFEDLSFGIGEGQKVALVAKNGTGKSTLLKIIAGKEDYEQGTISLRDGIKVGMLMQEPDFDPEHTVSEACFGQAGEIARATARYEAVLKRADASEDEMSRVIGEMDRLGAWDYEAKVGQILGKLGIHDLGQKVGTLSGGGRKRVALAAALIEEPDLLILDEPTNHLDLGMVEWLEGLLKASTMTLLMVTHDRYFLDKVCTEIWEMDRQTIFPYKGNYSYYIEKREARLRAEAAEMAHAKNTYRRELEWMRRMPQARGGKAKARQDNFHILEEKVKSQIRERALNLEAKGGYIGKKIFEAQYISKAYGEKVILKDFYYNFSRYEKLGIVGENGTGKSTFVKLLLGEEKPDKGVFDIGESIRFGYFRQEGIDFDNRDRVIDRVRKVADVIDLGGGRKMSASQLLERFLFSPEKQYDFIEKLSGGEKRRLQLCLVLMENPNFLVLDEPTNDLDIATLGILENYLQGFGGCVMVISHDRFFMDEVVDHLLVFHGNGKIQDFPGNYTQYRAWRDEQAKIEEKRTNDKPEKRETPKATDTEKPKKLTWKEQREWEALESEIAALEDEKKRIEDALSGAETDPVEIGKLSERMGEILNAIEAKEMRWLELSERA